MRLAPSRVPVSGASCTQMISLGSKTGAAAGAFVTSWLEGAGVAGAAGLGLVVVACAGAAVVAGAGSATAPLTENARQAAAAINKFERMFTPSRIMPL